jgi:hypothetical protein
VLTVAAVVPGRTAAPKLTRSARANSAQLKWTGPESDGGAPCTAYELRLFDLLAAADELLSSLIVYRGEMASCTVENLAPGRRYGVQVRAVNRMGAAVDWSDMFEFVSGAGAPDPPLAPNLTVLKSSMSQQSLLITWQEPCGNGAACNDYRLEWAAEKKRNSDESSIIQFVQLYTGAQTRYELRGGGFLAAQRYLFRVQAANGHGSSAFSACADFLTPAAVPGVCVNVRAESRSTHSVTLTWRQPPSNGSPILLYNVDFSESGTTGNNFITVPGTGEDCVEHCVDGLTPDSGYRVRVQAVNAVGAGQFSLPVKIRTKCLPPPAPATLECTAASYNSIKLKWSAVSSASSEFETNTLNPLVYVLEMKPVVSAASVVVENEHDDDDDEAVVDDNHNEKDSDLFTLIYKGPLTSYKASKLAESSEYLFRVAAVNEAGQGDWCEPCGGGRFATTTAPPVIHKAPFVTELTTSSCVVEWSAAKLAINPGDRDTVEYALQLAVVSGGGGEFKEVYRGELCSHRLAHLEPNTEYTVRVCATRLCYRDEVVSQRLVSPLSPNLTFSTLRVHHHHHHHHNQKQPVVVTVSSKREVSLDKTKSAKTEVKSSFFGRLVSTLSFSSNLDKKINENKKPVSRATQQLVVSNKRGGVRGMQHQPDHSNQKTAAAAAAAATTAVASSVVSNSTTSAQLSESGQQRASLRQQQRVTSDQWWALGLICVLIAIAFLIAYACMLFYDLSLVVGVSDESAASSSLSHFQQQPHQPEL